MRLRLLQLRHQLIQRLANLSHRQASQVTMAMANINIILGADIGIRAARGSARRWTSGRTSSGSAN